MRDHQHVMCIALVITACGDGGGFPDARQQPPVASGTFSLRWQLQGRSGAPETCAQANATSVHVSITNHATLAEYSVAFDCGLGAGISGELFTGTYDLTFQLPGSVGATASPSTLSVVVTSDAPATLPVITFVVP